MPDSEEMICENCGCEDSWEYVGEQYDDDEHIGSLYLCAECGHQQNDGDHDPWLDINWERYEG